MSCATAMPGCLYVVATPIGNLEDMTPRAIETLKRVSIIACEDTRTSGKLLAHFGIESRQKSADTDHHPTRAGHHKLWAYHEHNHSVQTPKLIEMMTQGHAVALISDAGTPLVSDPGYQLVQAAHAAGLTVSPIVGACAAISALSVAGLPSDRFSFIGFLPAKRQARLHKLEDLRQRRETLLFYEAPHRIVASIEDMAVVFGHTREVTFCRELTKTFETVHHSTLGALAEFVRADDNQQRGEIVLVVGGHSEAPADDIGVHDALLRRLLLDVSVKKAAALAADITGSKKNALYQRLLQLQQQE